MRELSLRLPGGRLVLRTVSDQELTPEEFALIRVQADLQRTRYALLQAQERIMGLEEGLSTACEGLDNYAHEARQGFSYTAKALRERCRV